MGEGGGGKEEGRGREREEKGGGRERDGKCLGEEREGIQKVGNQGELYWKGTGHGTHRHSISYDAEFV